MSYLEIVHKLQSNLEYRAIRNNLAQRLVVDAYSHVTVLYELVHRKESVVRLEICWSSCTKQSICGMTHFHDRLGDLWRWQD